jgi:hypothetical protein
MGISHFFGHGSEGCAEAKSICLKIDADAGFALPSGEQYVISNKDRLCNMVSRAHVSTTFAKSRIKFKTQTNFPTVLQVK